MIYALCVLVGVALSMLARSFAPAEPKLPHRHALSLIALIGATAGAFAFEAPADFFGWTGGIAGAPVLTHMLGGRTVLGGLLGGWIAVEAGKVGLGIRRPTGDGFALPLAIGLACGRMGCFFTGCCAGRVSTGHEWWSRFALPGHDGVLRFPAQLSEVAFHTIAALALLVMARRGVLQHRRFALYVAMYALFRFGMETVRDNPAVGLGLTYYQALAVALFLVAGVTVMARSVRRGEGWQDAPAVVR